MADYKHRGGKRRHDCTGIIDIRNTEFRNTDCNTDCTQKLRFRVFQALKNLWLQAELKSSTAEQSLLLEKQTVMNATTCISYTCVGFAKKRTTVNPFCKNTFRKIWSVSESIIVIIQTRVFMLLQTMKALNQLRTAILISVSCFFRRKKNEFDLQFE